MVIYKQGIPLLSVFVLKSTYDNIGGELITLVVNFIKCFYNQIEISWIAEFITQNSQEKIKKAISPLEISVLETFKFEKCVKYEIERTDRVIYSRQ